MQHPPSAFRSDSKMVAAWWLESVHVVTSHKWADFRLNNSDFDSLVSHASPFDERDPNSPQRMKKESLLMLCPREIEQPENRTVAKSNDLLSTKTAGLFRFLSFPTNLYKSFHSNTFSNFSESAEIGVASSLRLSSQKQALEAILNKHFSGRSQGQAIFKHLSRRSQGPFLVTREDNACTAHDCIQVFHIFPQCSGRLVQLEMLSLNPGKSWGTEWGNNLEVNSARHLLWSWKVKIRRISTSPTGLCHPTMGMLKGTAAISLLLATHDPELSKPFKEYASNTWNDWDTNSICTVALKGTSRSKKNREASTPHSNFLQATQHCLNGYPKKYNQSMPIGIMPIWPEKPGFSILLSLSPAFTFLGILIFFNGMGKGTRCIPFNKMGLNSSGTLGCITPLCREIRKAEKQCKTPPSTCCYIDYYRTLIEYHRLDVP